MKRPAFYLVNAITGYRLIASFILAFLLYQSNLHLFKWLLGVSFFTDLIDGFLARKLKVQSSFGARLDSVADDLTVFAGIAGMYIFKYSFFEKHLPLLVLLLALFFIQTGIAYYRYGKSTSFHTYLAKTAAIFQGTFLILLFFMDKPPVIMFYVAAFITAIELVEEIIITFVLSEWRTDVKGIFHVLRSLKIKQQE